MDISLSLKTTIIFFFVKPRLFRASKAIPPVIAPSPITAMTWLSSPLISLATAIPKAADTDVEL